MIEKQTVTVTFFRYRSMADRWWAFRQMGLAPTELSRAAGLSFFKLVGSGGGNGFSILPNLGVYGLLAVWENEACACRFFETHPAYAEFQARSEEQWTVFMRTVMAHGSWDRQAPFESTAAKEPDRLVAVLTRATIRTRHLWRFWKYTPPVSRSVENRQGLIFSVGIGELPIVQQATFSLWENSHLMQAYAYQSRRHSEVVRKTRELGWYEEELFARFRPYRTEGAWYGNDPLETYL